MSQESGGWRCAAHLLVQGGHGADEHVDHVPPFGQGLLQVIEEGRPRLRVLFHKAGRAGGKRTGEGVAARGPSCIMAPHRPRRHVHQRNHLGDFVCEKGRHAVVRAVGHHHNLLDERAVRCGEADVAPPHHRLDDLGARGSRKGSGGGLRCVHDTASCGSEQGRNRVGHASSDPLLSPSLSLSFPLSFSLSRHWRWAARQQAWLKPAQAKGATAPPLPDPLLSPSLSRCASRGRRSLVALPGSICGP